MISKYYQKNKEKLQKESRERYQNLSEEKKTKSANFLEKDIKIVPKKKKKKGVSIIKNISKSYLSIEEIII